MNTNLWRCASPKEAIEFLEHNYGVNFNWRGNFRYIVELLKRGEKFEQMWGEVKNQRFEDMWVDVKNRYGLLTIAEIEQKYFPKPKQRRGGKL